MAINKYDTFCRTLENLNDIYKHDEPYDTVTVTGMIKLYEICFEQAWKMMKEMLEEYGYQESAVGSPKSILKTAYKAGMIKDEDLWLSALVARNNVVHAYNSSIALEIARKTKEVYYQMFVDLLEEVDNNWQ